MTPVIKTRAYLIQQRAIGHWKVFWASLMHLEEVRSFVKDVEEFTRVIEDSGRDVSGTGADSSGAAECTANNGRDETAV